MQCPESLKGLVLAALGEEPSNRLKAVQQRQSPRQPDGMPQSKRDGELFGRLHHMPTGQAMNSQTSTPNSARLTASRVRSLIADLLCLKVFSAVDADLVFFAVLEDRDRGLINAT